MDLKNDQKDLNENIIKMENPMSKLTTDQKHTENNRAGWKKDLIKPPRNRRKRKRDEKHKMAVRDMKAQEVPSKKKNNKSTGNSRITK